MRSTLLLAYLVLMPSALSLPAGPWRPDIGDGTYRNPVLFADYSDPDVIQVGEDFYLTASSFNAVPGLPILHSRDLVNWTLISHAIAHLPDRFDHVQAGNGIWAPSIRYHDGWFWIFVGDPDWGVLMTKARDPRGPWTPLHVVQEGRGWIDPCPLWDDDGKAYLVHAWAGSRTGGVKDLLIVHEMSPDGTRLLGEGTVVVDGREGRHPTVEGPKWHKRDGFYYILAPAGGVTGGWQMAFRSRHPLGPYEERRVLEQGSTDINGPHQGALLDLPSGESWFVHFQDREAYGRIVHLNPVRWIDGWPLMGLDFDGNGIGEPVRVYQKPDVGATFPVAVPATSDEFTEDAIELQWQWYANPQPGWASLTERPGWLRMHAVNRPDGVDNLFLHPAQLLQKFPAPAFSATTRLEIAKNPGPSRAGLIVMGLDYHGLVVTSGPDGLRLEQIACEDARGGGEERVVESVELDSGNLWLRVEVHPEAICQYAYSVDGEDFTAIGAPLPAAAGRWIGAKVGLLCEGESGHADFDWFRIE